MTASFFTTRFWWGIAIPDHPNDGNDHANDHLYIEALFPKEQEAEDQYKDSLHVAEDLEGDSSKSAYADELAEICSHCNRAWQDQEHLKTQGLRLLYATQFSIVYSFTVRRRDSDMMIHSSFHGKLDASVCWCVVFAKDKSHVISYQNMNSELCESVTEVWNETKCVVFSFIPH